MTVAIYSWAGLGNLGDDWLLECLAKEVESAGKSVLLVLEPQASLPHTLQQFKYVHWPRIKSSPRGFKAFARQIDNCECFIFAGGGWFAADRGIREPIIWRLRLELIRINIQAIGLGVGPFHSFVGRKLGKQTANRIGRDFDINVRTLEDGVCLSRIGIPKFKVSSDLTLFDDRFANTKKSARSGIIISLPPPNSRWIDTDLDEWTQNFVKYVNTFAISSDITFLNFQSGEHADGAFWKQHFPNVYSPNNINDALSLLEGCSTALVGRLHAALGAIAANVPNIGVMGYHHKFELLENLGLHVTPWKSQEIVFTNSDKNGVLAEHLAMSGTVKEMITRISKSTKE